MKHWLLLCGIAALLAAGGCRSAKTIDGRDCYPLTDDQRQQVIDIARVSLLGREGEKNNKFTAEEQKIINETEPAFRIRYTGDYAGEVDCTWELPDKIVQVEAKGQFDDMSNPYEFGWRMWIFYRGPDVIYRSVPGREDTQYRAPQQPGKPGVR